MTCSPSVINANSKLDDRHENVAGKSGYAKFPRHLAARGAVASDQTTVENFNQKHNVRTGR